MKNIAEVAVFDLGRPFSTSSQLSVDEPDAKATEYGKQVIPGNTKLENRYPIPRIYKPVFRTYYDQGIPVPPPAIPPQTVFDLAKAELAVKSAKYLREYAQLKTDASLQNNDIYSSFTVSNLFQVPTASATALRVPGVPESVFRHSPDFTPKEADESIQTKTLNFYQVMMRDVAQRINNELNGPHIATVALAEELGYHLLAVFSEKYREARRNLQLIISLKSPGEDNQRISDMSVLYDRTAPAIGGFEYIYSELQHLKEVLDIGNPYKEALKLVQDTLVTVAGGDLSSLTPALLMELLTLVYPANSFSHTLKAQTDALKLSLNGLYPKNSFTNIRKQILDDIQLYSNQKTPWKSIQPKRINTWSNKGFDLVTFGGEILRIITELSNPGPNWVNIQAVLWVIETQLDTHINEERTIFDNIKELLIDKFITLYFELVTMHDPEMAMSPANTALKLPFVDARHYADIDTNLSRPGVGPDDYRLDTYFRDGLRGIFSLARMPTSETDSVGRKGFGMSFSSERIDHVIEQIAKQSCQLQNTIMIRSPTGTGKTKQYMLLIAGLRRDETPQFKNRPHTIVFTSNAPLAKQAFGEFIVDLNETVTIVTEETKDIPGKPSAVVLSIKTKEPTKGASLVTEVEVSRLQPCNTHTENGRINAFQVSDPSYKISQQMYSRRISGRFGGIIIAPLYLYDLMYTAGVLDDTVDLQTVVFDEVDVFYNKKSIPEFHQFFFTRPSIYRARNVVFCSATVDPEFIRKYDQQLIQTADRLMWTKFTSNTGIQDSANTSVQTHMNSNYILPQASINNTVGKYIYIGYWDNVDIRDTEYTLFRSYGQFKGRSEPETAIQRVLQYNKRAITSNRPIYAFNMKDTHRLPFMYIEPIEAFASLITVDVISIPPTKAGMKAFAINTVLDRLLKVTYKRTCKEIIDGTTVDYGSKRGPVVVNAGLRHQSTRVIQNSLGYLYHIEPARYEGLAIQLSKSLFLHIQNDQSFKALSNRIDREINKHFSNTQRARMEEVFVDHGQKQIQDISEDIVAQDQPFYSALLKQLRLGSGEPNKNLLLGTADFFQGGRGLDIPALVDVYIILPMYQSLSQLKIEIRSIKQAVGRVGRAQRVGNAHLVQFMHQPGIADSATFDAFCGSIGIPSIKASYEQIGFDGYLANCALVDSFMVELKKQYRQ